MPSVNLFPICPNMSISKFHPNQWASRDCNRHGTITVLSTFVFIALLIVGAMTINLTQLATTKTEMRLAADAASKAGAIVLGKTQSISEARQAAKRIAARHKVNDRNMQIYNIDVDFGYSEKHNDGSYDFTENAQPYNSVKVHVRLDEESRSGVGNFYMAGIINPNTFDLNYSSLATRVDHDLCLVVDRSGSMAWDTSDVPWSYPMPEAIPGNLGTSRSIIQSYFLKPHSTDSRWAAITRSTEIFFEHLDSLTVDVQSGLVSYSSNFVFGLYNSQASTTHSGLTDDYEMLQQHMVDLGEEPLIGNTNIASGMQAAVEVLTGEDSRVTAKGTMVVLTDGIGNQGRDPVDVAIAAAAANVTVHTITFSEQADQQKMMQVAAAGGGNHFHAPNESVLRDIFKQIADTLPAVLMKE